MRRYVEQRFSPERMVDDYVAAYEAAGTARGGFAPRTTARSSGSPCPALGSLAAEPLYVLVDTAIVGHLGRSQLAALGLAATVLTALFALFNFLQYGTTAQVARASGAGEQRSRTRSACRRRGSRSAAGIGVAALVVGLAPGLVDAIGAEGETADFAVTYLRIAALGLPFAFLALGGQGYLRGSATCGRRS